MRVGVISDTHGVLPNAVFDIFTKVDRIIHAGDVGDPDILLALEAVCPVTAVYGNTDDFDLRDRLPKIAKVDCEGLYVTVTHGDQFGRQHDPAHLRDTFPDADVIIVGHTHKPLLQLVDKTVTVMNPGSCAFPRGGMAPSVGIMEFEAGLPPRARHVPLLD